MVRLEDQGRNTLHKQKRSELLKLFRNLVGLHNGPLWFAAALCILMYLSEMYLVDHDLHVKPDNVSAWVLVPPHCSLPSVWQLYIGCGLVAFVFAFGIFSYYMEAKCEYYLESGRDYVSLYSTVIRDGVPKEVFQEQLVIGDLVMIRQGDEVCADLKLVECAGVRVNLDMLPDREKQYYDRLYGSSDRLFHTGDILFRNSFIFSGNIANNSYSKCGLNVSPWVY